MSAPVHLTTKATAALYAALFGEYQNVPTGLPARLGNEHDELYGTSREFTIYNVEGATRKDCLVISSRDDGSDEEIHFGVIGGIGIRLDVTRPQYCDAECDGYASFQIFAAYKYDEILSAARKAHVRATLENLIAQCGPEAKDLVLRELLELT